jgi:N-acetylglucosaminyl-diphospho-decaprenol L-rhamnosyltransferase
MNKACTIVIVSYNCREALQTCLVKLNAEGDTPPIIVVDNASTDGTVAMIAADFPTVRLIRNAENHGFAAACNQGIRACVSDFILLLNPDTLLKRAALQKLTDTMRGQPNVGACGPRVLNTDGSLQPSCRRFPTLGAMICDELGLGRLFPHSRRLARYRMSGWQHNETRDVDQVMGSCVLLRRMALEHVGLLDERFFLYFEEVDLCKRLRQSGWRVVFVADATVTHLGGECSKTDPRNALGHRYSSLFAFYRKHYSKWQLPVLRLVVQIAAFARAVCGQRDYWPVARYAWKL